MASFPCEAAALAAAAVHSAEASRSMRAVADCMAAAAGLAARSQQCGPAVEGPEIELDIELGAPDPSPDSSSPSSALSSSSTMLEAFEVLCSFLTDFQDLIFQIVLSIFMGSPIYPSLSHISKESDPAFLLFFLMYCGAWILITTALLFMFFGKSKQERLGRIWTCHLIIMALCIGTVLLTYVLIPYQQRTSNINIAVWALLCSIISSHVTAWNLRVDASSLSWARSGASSTQ